MPNKKQAAAGEQSAEIERLRKQVEDAEQHGQTDTCHHQLLERLIKEQNAEQNV